MADQMSWVCMVCGYVHQGSEPPDTCPVCGVSRTEFQKQEPPGSQPPGGQVKKWRCRVCGYEHEGADPPAICPVCDAPASEFVEIPAKAGQSGNSPQGSAKTYVIVGAGIAGLSAAEEIRTRDASGKIILISKEAELPYYRLNLTRFIAGDLKRRKLDVYSEAWYQDKDIELIRGQEVEAIDLNNKRLKLRRSGRQSFDRLVLTTGARPFMPPIPGITREGVTSIRTVDQCQQLSNLASGGKCLCVGGGLLGLETAGALSRHGVSTEVLEFHKWLMPQQLNQAASELLIRLISGDNLKIRTEAAVEEILGDERVRAVKLTDGSQLESSLVVIAAGVRPNIWLAQATGLTTNRGIVVDEYLRTSHPDVFAAGDCAEPEGGVSGLWSISQVQGRVAGHNAVSADQPYTPPPRSTSLKVLGVDVISIGKPTEGDKTVVAAIEDRYLSFSYRDDVLTAALMVGDGHLMAQAQTAIEKKERIADTLHGSATAEGIAEYLESLEY